MRDRQRARDIIAERILSGISEVKEYVAATVAQVVKFTFFFGLKFKISNFLNLT